MNYKIQLFLGSLLASTFLQAQSIESKQSTTQKVQLYDLMCVVRETPDGAKYQAAIAANTLLSIKDLERDEQAVRGEMTGLNILYSELMNDCTQIEKLNNSAARRFGFVDMHSDISKRTYVSSRPNCTYTRIEAVVTLTGMGNFDSDNLSGAHIKFQGAGNVLHCNE